MKRRTFIGTTASASLGILACKPAGPSSLASSVRQDTRMELKNNIKHSVCYWPFNSIPLEEFLLTLQTLGIKAIDLSLIHI